MRRSLSGATAAGVAAGVVVIVVALVALAAAHHDKGGEPEVALPSFRTLSLPPVPQLARDRGIAVGAGINAWRLRLQPRYADTLVHNFTSVTEQNVFKMRSLAPAPGRFNFTAADQLASFAASHQLRLRGHTLVWGSAIPAWVLHRHWSRQGLLQFLHAYITTVVTHFRGRAAQWDVVNEPFDPTHPQQAGNTLWERVIGPEYIPLAFRWAHEADPSAKLFLNDYGNEVPGPRARAEFRLLRTLRDDGVPIDGVGLQMHLYSTPRPTAPQVITTLRAYASLGLDVEMTEMDVPLPQPPSERDLIEQALTVRAMTTACVVVPACTGVTFWGLDDADRYPAVVKRHLGSATLFDADDQPKLAVNGLAQALAFAPGRPGRLPLSLLQSTNGPVPGG